MRSKYLVFSSILLVAAGLLLPAISSPVPCVADDSLTDTFYFAEGTCRPNFDPYICIQNPGATDAGVTITYMKGDGNTDQETLTVAKNSRSTVTVKNMLGEADDEAHDFSAKVECTNGQDIIAERAQYFNYDGVWTGGHDVIGQMPAAELPFTDTGRFGILGGGFGDKDSGDFVQAIRDAGIGWLRPHPGPFVWGYMQNSSQSQFNFTITDELVGQSRDEGFNMLVTLWPYADWDQLARPNADDYRVPSNDQFIEDLPLYRSNPVDWTAYGNWLTAVVERYDGDGYNDMNGLRYPIRYWEIINEPDINYDEPSDLNFFMGEPEDYATLLNNSYATIRTADSNAQILIAAPAGNSPDSLNYFQRVFAVDGAKNSFNIGNIHCISSGHPEDFNVADYRDSLEASGINKPIWVTEAENVEGDELAANADRLDQSVAGAINAGAEKIFFTGASMSGGEHKYGHEAFIEQKDIYKEIISKYQ